MTSQTTVLPHTLHGGGEHKVIALHGWFADRNAFAPLLPHLDGERFSYAFVDYRGYGEARGTAGAYTIDETADDVLATADALGWERFSLVGHSMGGKAAQAVVVRASDRVARFVGLSPVPASGMPFDDGTWELFSSAVDDPAARRAIIDFTTGGRLTGTWLDTMVRTSLERSDPEAFRSYLLSWAKEDFGGRLAAAPRPPALVVLGEHDPGVGEAVVRPAFGQCYPEAVIDVMPNVGHYSPDEAPIVVASVIERFLAGS